MYVPCILFSLLTTPTNAQHIVHICINNTLHIVNTATCSDLPAYRKHQHIYYTYKTAQTVYTATKQTTSMYCNYEGWNYNSGNYLFKTDTK